ncbi:MAG: protein-glutamate O-methyltransferase CheR [Proteobacteria bacterium]|nr:protein-glutamate O-methyltransferase CheR [Pseudomonadota bacterium]
MTGIQTREFEFTDDNFQRIRRFVSEHTGIVLSDAKKNMVYGRLSKRIRKGGFKNFTAFCKAIDEGDEQEQEFLINAITTNLTSFFRENHHFEFLADTIIPELVKEKGHDKRLRIWSAGCSTGEEPYSIAITLKEALPNFSQWDVKILATDLDANVIEHGKQGIYRADRIEGLTKTRAKRWFHRGRGDNADMVKVKDELKQMIHFKRLNLLDEWPMKGPFDLMFCRNVVIYFDKPTQKVLFERYEKILKSRAYMFIGHSESLYKVTTDFESLKHTTYRKKT